MSATVQTRQACGFTQGKLDQFLEKASYDIHSPAFKVYFFTNMPGTKKHQTRDDLDDEVVRCLKCGCTIDERPLATKKRPRNVSYIEMLNAS